MMSERTADNQPTSDPQSTSKILQLLKSHDQLPQLQLSDIAIDQKIYEPIQANIESVNFPSIVYKAQLNSAAHFNTPVAVKEMHYNILNHHFCEKESSVLGYLTDQHLKIAPTFYGYMDDTEKRDYRIVMEYFPAGSLSDNIDEHCSKNWEAERTGYAPIPPPAWDQRQLMIKRFLLNLSVLHHQDLVHCDLKTPNVLLVKNDQDQVTDVKLCDFAFAGNKGDRVTTLTGTVGYLSPEMSRLYFPSYVPWVTRSVDLELSEIYSAATISFEIATWYPPAWVRHRMSFADTLRFTIHRQDKQKLPEDCSKGVAEMITWGWHQDPTKRPSLDEMLNLVEGDIEHAELERSEAKSNNL